MSAAVGEEWRRKEFLLGFISYNIIIYKKKIIPSRNRRRKIGFEEIVVVWKKDFFSF